MDRREFLTARRKTAAPSQPSITKIVRTSVAGINPYTGSLGTAELVHLLKRTMFGAAKADIEYFKNKSLSDIVDELLNPGSSLPSPPVKEYDSSNDLNPDTAIAMGTTWVNDINTDGTIKSRRRSSFKKWWMGQMIKQDRSIREKLTLFWHNHFSTETVVVDDPLFIYRFNVLLRKGCLGNFKSLVKGVTLDASMLVYLNGNASTLTAPNENYGRELQELFTIGTENTPNYNEVDVKAAARVLTGWRTSTASLALPAYYDNARHDKNNKVFSSFYNKTITTRNTATAGDLEIDDLLTMIFNKKDEVSKFIVKKLYRWFCYYDIDADTEASVILPLAKIFQDSNWEILPVLSALFKSEHFFDTRIRGCLLKSPIDLSIAMTREFNMTFPDVNTSFTPAYTMYENLRNYSSTMGQNIGDPLNVAGWAAYYQEPQFHEIWFNSDTLPKRNKFTDLFIGTSGYSTGGFKLIIDPVAFARSLSDPGDPNKLINQSLDIIFSVPISDTSKATIKKQILLTGQETDQYWTDAWISYLANPATTGMPYKTVLSRLQTLYKYFMNLAEYQLS